MKKQKLIATAILVTLMWASISVFANNDLKIFSPLDKESVIESLLKWKKLTSEQKSIKSEMIKEISERKTRDIEHKNHNHKHLHKHKDKLPKHLYDKLSSEEKTKFDKMSDSEKKIFLDSKREEERKYRKIKEKVMYNLVAWIKLNSKQEEIRKEIKKEMEEKMLRDALHIKIKNIEEKIRNWKTLSDSEKNILKNFKAKRP